MRVIAGSRRSLPLKAPKSNETRPTTDRIKETLFNMLQAEIPGARVLDLFAGSGSLGIESLSRGAGRVVFVDQSAEAVSVIRQNLAFTRLEAGSLVLKCDAPEAIRRMESAGETFDLVFLDPPYESGLDVESLKQFVCSRAVHDGTLFVVEASIKADVDQYLSLGYDLIRDKRYKTNRHLFLKRSVGSHVDGSISGIL